MFKLETIDNIYRYIDTNTNNEIEIALNLDPILDCNFKYSNLYLLNNFALLKYAINDIQNKFNNLTYIAKEYNRELENKLKALNFKISLFDYEILPSKEYKPSLKLQTATNKKESYNYILRELNESCYTNSKYLNITFKEYTEKIFEIEKEKYIIEVLEENGLIKGAVEYFVQDKVYIRNIFADSSKYLEEIIINLFKYKVSITLGCIYMNKDLKSVIEKFNGKTNYVYYIWKEERLWNMKVQFIFLLF